jgi:hypothetical protein
MCTDGSDNETSTFTFLVNASGTDFTTGHGLIYLFILFIAIFVFLLLLYGAIKIPFKNPRTEAGEIAGVSSVKYLKIMCVVMCYLTMIWILYMAQAVSRFFTFLDFASGILYLFGFILLAGLFPVSVLGIWISLVLFFEDKKIKKALSRGLRV